MAETELNASAALATIRWALLGKVCLATLALWLCCGCIPEPLQEDRTDPQLTRDHNSNELSPFDPEFGRSYADVRQQLEALWQSAGDCSVDKTGFGVDRRAYFLDTCKFTNASGLTFCSRSIDTALYRFFEGQLVQLQVAFNDVDDADVACVAAFAADNKLTRAGMRWVNRQGTVSVEVVSDKTTRFSDEKNVSKIHLLRGNR